MNTQLLEELEQLLKWKKSRGFYAEKLGITIEEVDTLMAEIKGKKTIVEEAETGNYIAVLEDRVVRLEEDIANNTAQLTGQFREEIKTLDELIEKCRIDTSIWKIDKYVQNFWGNAESPKWQVKAFLSKRQIDKDLQAQKELILREIATTPRIPQELVIGEYWSSGDTLLELSLPDLHIGKLGWVNESGENYDIKIAVARYKEAISELLSRVNLEQVERIHLPIGNDAIHVDNPENTTTAGTAVDTEGRFPKIIEAAKTLFVETIDYLKTIAPVDVTIVRGNHDSVTMFMLGEVLDAWYRNDFDVDISSEPQFRKYYQYGVNGFLFTHGDKEKHDELGLIFATEEPKLWAATKYRFCKLGHLHRNKKTKYIAVDSKPGFQIQILPSLSGTDEWHYAHGYLSNKQAKAFLYHKEKGEIAEFTYTV